MEDSQHYLLGRIALLFIAIPMFWFGWGAFETYLSNRFILALVLAIIAILGGVGLILNKHWSRFPVYAITAYGLFLLLAGLHYEITVGYGYDNPRHAFFGFLIASVPSMVMLICSYTVCRHFSQKAENRSSGQFGTRK